MTHLDWLIVLIPVGLVAWVAVVTQRYMLSVADFCSASRVAGRYVIANARGETGMAVVSFVAGLEVFYRAGWTMGWWGFIAIPVGMLMTLTGFVNYRYRETRVMTIAQFFEIRYSRGFRLLAGFMAFVSGIVNYGIFPAVSARFFVYFCGLPQSVVLGGMAVPTFAIIMFLYLSATLFVVITGGQITIMVTDCLEGLLSLLLYFVVIVALLLMFSWREVHEALAMAPPGLSRMDPFDTKQISDFNLWFVLIGVFGAVYNHMAWQGGHAYNSAAKTPHESKMAAILGNWRGFGKGLFTTLLGIAAYTFLVHPDFAQQAAAAGDILAKIDNPQIANQMRMPVALGLLLPIGVKGVVCALFLLGLIACETSYIHSWGTIFVQDLLVPLRKKPFSTKQHLFLLRLSIVGVGVFGFLFSLLYRQTDYILMFFAITGAIYLGGAGSVIIGGFYWRKGTNAGAWTAMLSGSSLAVFGVLIQQPAIWGKIHVLLNWAIAHVPFLGGLEALRNFAQHLPPKFPIHGQWMYFIAMATAASLYVIVSLLTCREDFNMDRMLHRGKYALDEHGAKMTTTVRTRWTIKKFLGVDAQYTKGDKVITYSLFSWKMFWLAVGAIITLWNFVDRWPLSWWSTYWRVNSVYIPFILAIPTTIWFFWGGIRDLRLLFTDLRNVTRKAHDDGTVVGHRNLDEAEAGQTAKAEAPSE
ncbi:MAG: sodium:proline symporter [Verrucomicrobiae bacterium]|nr:sodium:proline symporter [Verrucomicrobiae bacterium]